jgi:hypothetical protein
MKDGLKTFISKITSDHVLELPLQFFRLLPSNMEVALHREFKVQEQTIEKIVLSVSTRYVATFPGNLSPIKDYILLQAGKGDELLIQVDFIGYGMYSSPTLFKLYLKEIKDAKRERGANVKVLIYGGDAAKKTLLTQFSKEDYAKLTSSAYSESDSNIKERRERFRLFLNVYQKNAPKTYEDFLNLLISVQDTFCRELHDEEIEVRTHDNPAIQEAVFFWMVPRKEMIFAFTNLSDTEKGFSFKTSDDHLMDIFYKQFDDKWKTAPAISGSCYPTAKLFSAVQRTVK